MKFNLLFAISETSAKTGDFRRHFIISQFATALRKKGINCKIIDDLDIYGNSKLNKKYLRWITKPQKLETVINEFKPDIVFTERASHFSSLILKYKIPLMAVLANLTGEGARCENCGTSYVVAGFSKLFYLTLMAPY